MPELDKTATRCPLFEDKLATSFFSSHLQGRTTLPLNRFWALRPKSMADSTFPNSQKRMLTLDYPDAESFCSQPNNKKKEITPVLCLVFIPGCGGLAPRPGWLSDTRRSHIPQFDQQGQPPARPCKECFSVVRGFVSFITDSRNMLTSTAGIRSCRDPSAAPTPSDSPSRQSETHGGCHSQHT
jgi:hypothetical protein